MVKSANFKERDIVTVGIETCGVRAHLQKVVDANLCDSDSEQALRGAIHAGRDEKTYRYGDHLWATM
jgi:predicted ArsR family transcriptional regulator